MCKYSIIIPIYNAESTLDRCLSSLVSQNYKDAEIILVNDGSCDKTDEICKYYAKKNKQIIYISQKNMGVSEARNNGIAKATGKYILFVDSDDFVVSDYFKQLDQMLNKHDADLIIFSENHYKDKKTTIINRQPFFSDQKDVLYRKISELMCNKIISGPVTKVYKREIINQYNVFFPAGISIGEDRAFNIKYALHIKSLSVEDIPLYTVVLDNGTSLSRGGKSRFSEQAEMVKYDIESALEQCDLSQNEKNYIIEALNFGECRTVYTYAKMFWKNKVKRSERYKKIRCLCQEIKAKHLSYPKMRYCKLIILPVRFELVWLIDFMAWKLTH